MKLLAELREKDLGIKLVQDDVKYKERRAARAVVFDDEGNVAVSHVKKGDYWKIPGGGIEDGEDRVLAIEREAQEEAGVGIEIEQEVGKIIEYRDQWDQKQISYCYTARVVGDKRQPNYTQSEIEEDFELYWLSYEEALEKFGDVSHKPYEARFMQTRDGLFLKEARKYLSF